MKNLRIIFIALLPPVITGQSIMSQVFLDFLIKKKANIKVIRLSPYLDTNTGITLVKKTYNYLFFFYIIFSCHFMEKKLFTYPEQEQNLVYIEIC